MNLPGRLSPDETLHGLNDLVGRPGVDDGFVRLRQAILQGQIEVFRAVLASGWSLPPDDEGPDRPAVTFANAPFDHDLASGLLRRIAQCGPPDTAGGAPLRRAVEALVASPGRLEETALRLTLDGDPMLLAVVEVEVGVPGEVLELLGRLVAAPFVSAAAVRLEAPSDEDADEGRCPVCGAAPGLASLAGDAGRRVLHCSLCAGAWPFARLRCPFCVREGPRGLDVLAAADDGARRIEACPECRGYLKTIDLGRLAAPPRFAPLVEDTATQYLDVLAQREGLLGNSWYAAMA